MPMFCVSIKNLPADWIPEADSRMYEYWFINDDVQPPTRQPITLSAIHHHGIAISPENTHIDTKWPHQKRFDVFKYNRIPWIFDVPVHQPQNTTVPPAVPPAVPAEVPAEVPTEVPTEVPADVPTLF